MSNPVSINAVPGTSLVEISREFEAPADALFRAHADPELFAQWIGPRALQTSITRWDFSTGGGYGFEQQNPQGGTYGFRGVFHTIVPDELIIQTFEYLGAPHEVSLDRMRFEALPDGRSRLISRSVFTSQEAVEQMIASGMEHGVVEGYEKLDELLAR
ncbi:MULTISPECIES: SRPBCC family protein [Arthrobacter]|uniref:SRPBCC family protein n=2 Tax=Arthrobacter TaxID=1663 RepID=A0ABU9KMC2_9MICC|nr:SRPBCC family protein [Arthrobacter sp. YJM1]MDP5227493.1 SRPBCC family protein [Arthrobacter sp. YJM1]